MTTLAVVIALRKFKCHLPLLIHHEVRRERLSRLGNEFREHVGAARIQQFLRLLRFDGLLKYFPPDLELAGFSVPIIL